MKYYIYLLVLFFIFLKPFQISAKKIALIVAISEYEFCKPLHTEKDVELLKITLTNQGFQEKYIYVLLNEKVSRQNLIRTFRTNLIEVAEPGDIVFFHFSGHGQQVIDVDGDEADGYDESLVCYSAWPNWDETEYKGEEHLIDDDLNILLTDLRLKVGNKGSVLVLIDACFSGTISRSNETIRGNFNAIAPFKYTPTIKAGNNNSSGLEASPESEKLASIVIISASKQDEFNYETKTENGDKVGSLSYVFSKCLNSRLKIKTYRGLFDYIKIKMAIIVPFQTPIVEGNIDIELFGGKVVSEKNYYKVKQIKDGHIYIDVGKIGNIYEGTMVGLYPVDTKKPNIINLLTNAEVIKSNDFDAIIKLEKKLLEVDVINSWVYIKEKSYGEMKVNVFIDSNNKSWEEISKKLIKHPLIRIVNEDNILTSDIIIKDSISKSGKLLINYFIKNDNNSYIDTLENISTNKIIETIEKEIVFYSKAKYLKQLELNNPKISIDLQFLAVKKYETRGGRYIATEFGKPDENLKDGQIGFKKEDLFVFQIENKGDDAAYFQIMDLQPDNSVSILIPEPGTSEGDMKIEVGQTIVFASKIMQISEPLGTDMFKIIASPEPLYNLRNIVENLKDTRGKPKTPFEILTQDICMGTRGTKPFSVPINTVNINSVIIKTVEK